MKCPFSNATFDSPAYRLLLDEYEADGPKLCPGPYFFQQPDTILSIAFVGGTQRRFSSANIVVYGDASAKNHFDSWSFEPFGSEDDDVCRAPINDPTLPQLTIAFKVCRRKGSSKRIFHLLSSSWSLDDDPHRQGGKSGYVLWQRTRLMTSETRSVSMAFHHDVLLHTSLDSLPVDTCPHGDPNCSKMRIVRVLPVDRAPPKAACRLPTEILMHIFKYCNACSWQQELLALAQVCRQWSGCAMKLIFDRLDAKWRNGCRSCPESLYHCAFAKAFGEAPVLGLCVQHLDIDQHNEWTTCWNHWTDRKHFGFGSALVIILRATKNLERLHLALGHSSSTKSFFSDPPPLPRLQILSIEPTPHRESTNQRGWTYTVNALQLARCMSQWSSLTSLTVHNLRPGTIGRRRHFMRSPSCALQRLCVRHSPLSDGDLAFLTAASADTLADVTLDDVWGLTHGGLRAFLGAIARRVTSLTLWDLKLRVSSLARTGVPALDDAVDKMRRLERLNVSGADVATVQMLRRRSEMFSREGSDGMPVVRLSFRNMPPVWSWGRWPGWETVGVCDSDR